MKNFMKIVSVVFAVLLILICTISTATATVSEITETTLVETIEIPTRSALIIDRSGSIEDQEEVNEVLNKVDQMRFDFVGYFDDSQISLDPDYRGGGDSAICETVDEVAKLGYTHITVITDGQQWPREYSSLGVYSDLNLTVHLVGDKKQDSEELIDQLKRRLVNSNLKVVKPDGKEEILLDTYQAPIYEIKIPIPDPAPVDATREDEGNKTFIENIKEGYFPWWLVLILATTIAAIFDLIHELITRRTIPAKVIAQIAGGARVLADLSGSMAKMKWSLQRACKNANSSETLLCFGETVEEVKPFELSKKKAQGCTAGWEAIESASIRGWDEIVLVSDLKFNRKPFDEKAFAKKFKKITVVAPKRHDSDTFVKLKKIAEEVEVVSL